jgi:release factor glutamine methyltransferase
VEIEMEFRGLRIKLPEEVYLPSDDTYLLIENLQVKPSDCVLEIGTGCGLVSLIVAQTARKVIATDISPIAVECARKNVEYNHFSARVELREGSLFEPIDEGEFFDLILFNAPYLPHEVKREGAKLDWLEKAWDGGKTGRQLIDPFIKECKSVLNPSGMVQLVQSTLSDDAESCQMFEEQGYDVRIIASKASFFEKIVVISAVLID